LDGRLPARTLALLLVAALLATACVTITPIAHVGSDVTPPPATTPSAVPSPHGSPDQSTNSSQPPSGNPPGPTPGATVKPPKTPKPAPTASAPTATPAATAGSTANPNDPACFDDAYTLEGFAWNTVYRWQYNMDSTPAGYDPAAVLAVIQSAFDNVVDERNDCGRPDNIHALAQYQGKTSLTGCADQPDGENTVSWSDLPSNLSPDTIAYTCPSSGGPNGDIASDADIVINDQIPWALSKSDCQFQELLEPTITHEVGHVFGLGHVSERQHPDLTMSTRSNGPCDDSASTLGLGDMLGLESLYPGN
jgi:hypothetical protein